MERRNIDFDVTLSRAEWDQLGRTAAAIPDSGVLDWRVTEPERIEVRVRDEDSPSELRGMLSDTGRYGADQRKVAEFVFNDGRPFATISDMPWLQPPVVTPEQEQAIGTEVERWVRNKWHELVKEAGIEPAS